MRSDFAAFILSHGRPDRIHTLDALKKCGYTGKIFIVIDDEDECSEEYRSRHGDMILQFCKKDYAAILDDGDNTGKRTSTIYARSAIFDLAIQVGCKHFIQLDDDYTNFEHAFNSSGVGVYQVIKHLDDVFDALVEFKIRTGCKSIAIAQGGDFLGGYKSQSRALRRKAMNTFICSVDDRWDMLGRMNEDVTTYVVGGRQGELWFTTLMAKIVQKQTQSNDGGMSGLYLDSGTFVKSFYSVMYAPSCVQIGTMGDHRSPHYRIHHKINWHKTAPKILRETFKK